MGMRHDNYVTNTERKNMKSSFDAGRIYMAEVMDTRNCNRAGEIKVWLLDSNIDKRDSERWLTASYASSFYGTSPYEANDIKEFEYSPVSFGAWFPMPFVGNYVFVFFPAGAGENVNPYWFACPVNPRMNSMIPGIPSQYFGENNDPLTEMNDKMPYNESAMRGVPMCKREEGRAVYTPLKNALKKQGLETDNIRGYSTAGSQREAPSMCYGFLTPLGNSFTMDDGWLEDDVKQTWKMGSVNRELRGKDGLLLTQRKDSHRNNAGFRFRTRNGTQLWIGDEGNIYAINADGSAWCEISDDGKLHGYAQKSVDIACDGDINLKSKKKIRMEADEGFVFKTSGDVSFESAGNINVLAPIIKARSELQIPDIKANNATIDSVISQAASLRGVFAGTLDGTAYAATTVESTAIPQPIPYTPEANIQEPIIEEKKLIKTIVGSTEESIVSEMPSHEPYSGHTNRDEYYITPVLDTNVYPYESEKYKNYGSIVSNQISAVCPVPPEYVLDPSIPEENLSEHFTLAMLCSSQTAVNNGLSNVPTDEHKNNLKYLANEVLEKIWWYFCQDRDILDNNGQKIGEIVAGNIVNTGTANITNTFFEDKGAYNNNGELVGHMSDEGIDNGYKVYINSGYRGKRLNALVGGASESQHCFGEAADIEIAGIRNFKLANWIRYNIPFDQLILEYVEVDSEKEPNSGWVHVSYRYGRLRRDIRTINSRTKNKYEQGLIV